MNDSNIPEASHGVHQSMPKSNSISRSEPYFVSNIPILDAQAIHTKQKGERPMPSTPSCSQLADCSRNSSLPAPRASSRALAPTSLL